MIIDKEVKVKANSRQLKRYNELGYKCKLNDFIFIKVEHLSKGSREIVNVECDYCNKIIQTTYKQYIRNTKNGKYACCKKCSQNKIKETCLEKYGVDNVAKLEENTKKAQETNIKKYGCVCTIHNPKIREKVLETWRKNYGTTNPTKCKEVKEKIEKTCLEKYGVKSYLSTKDCIEKKKKATKEKYGVEYILQSEDFRMKQKEKNLELYGIENYCNTEECKTKTKNTNNKKYGKDYHTQTKDFRKKIRKTWGYENDLDKELFEDYATLVRNESRKLYKKLYDSWDGLDYYTKENILGLTEDPNDENYPNVDHKISIRYGFDNNITIDEISKIENLCICSRKNNIKKSSKNEDKYRIQLIKEKENS